MPFLGTIVNCGAVILAGVLGSLVKRGIPKRISEAIMTAMGIAVVYIGIDGALEAAPAVPEGSFFSAGLVKLLIMILSMALGTLIGELIDFDALLNKLGRAAENKFARKSEKGNFARGFVSCSILFCIGAMAVNGSIQDAAGVPDILLAKSVIDAIACFTMATTLGIGCAFSALILLLYQGGITLIALLLSSVVAASAITYMSVTGSLIIVFIGLNMIGVTKVKTANMIPAIFLPLLFDWLFRLIL